jgi:hypothetical protein
MTLAADPPGPLRAEPAVTPPDAVEPLSRAETVEFMQELADFVFEHHLKQADGSPQRGMLYEYRDMRQTEGPRRFVQGEALDTMHDGAWFAAALVNAHRASGDEHYKDFLTEDVLPFYLKMLNHGDDLFTNEGATPGKDGQPWGKVWAYQENEKGFVPYWWDDGGSVSLERLRTKDPRPIRPSHEDVPPAKNTEFLLSGYSLGMSNHMAQDLGVMLETAWLLLKDSNDPADRRLAVETAEAARNLHESRLRHHGFIPMCVAPAALANADAELLKRIPAADDPRLWQPDNHYTRALRDYKPGQKMPTPGFADNEQYLYYAGIARTGGKLPDPLAFKLVYDAFTEPFLYRYYSDDVPVPPGINRFDLHPYDYIDGKPADYRSDRKGPSKGPRPIGSRMGPQNMIVAGWALQILKERPELWDEPYRRDHAKDLRVPIHDLPPANDRSVRRSVPPMATLPIKSGHLGFTSIREALWLYLEADAPTTITFYSEPDGRGRSVRIDLDPAGTATLVRSDDGAGEKAKLEADVRKAPEGKALSVTIPYTVAKGQREWFTATEHGRASIRVGDELTNLYFLSPTNQVCDQLTDRLGGGLRTWRAMFREYGYIPTGLNAGGDWQHYSDTGGYAHLLSAASQWLMHLDGRRDWQEW